MSGVLAAGSGGASRVPPDLLVALLPLVVLIVALDAWCLTDLVRAKSARNAPKAVWALVILFVNAPIGPLLYLFLGRDRDGGRLDRPVVATSGLTRNYGGAGLSGVDLVVPALRPAC